MAPAVFAIMILFCTGDTPAVDTCTVHKIEPPNAISVEECRRIGASDAKAQTEAHQGWRVRGVRCLTLDDLQDATEPL